MGLTQLSTSGVKDAAVTAAKIGNSEVTADKIGSGQVTEVKLATNAVTQTKIADNAVIVDKIADQAVTLAKLPHGTSSNDGKFLRANNGADPTFETVTGTTINNNADNRVITGSGTANTLNGEANLTFDGGNLVSKGDNGITIEATSTNTAGQLTIIGVNNNNNVSAITRIKSVSTGSSSAATATTFSNRNSSNAVNEHMRIGSSGNVGIGNDASFPVYTHANSRNFILGTGSESTALQIHSANNLYGGIYFGDVADRTNLGSYIGSIEYKHGDDYMNFRTNGSERLRIQSGGGISFNGDAAAANALDDYEEGTWTPTTPIGAMQTVHGAHYTKIGRMVNVQAYVTMPISSNSAVSAITGFPFTSLGSSHYAVGAAYCSMVGNHHFFMQMSPNSTSANPHYGIGHGISYASASGDYVLFSMTYFTS